MFKRLTDLLGYAVFYAWGSLVKFKLYYLDKLERTKSNL